MSCNSKADRGACIWGDHSFQTVGGPRLLPSRPLDSHVPATSFVDGTISAGASDHEGRIRDDTEDEDGQVYDVTGYSTGSRAASITTADCKKEFVNREETSVCARPTTCCPKPHPL